MFGLVKKSDLQREKELRVFYDTETVIRLKAIEDYLDVDFFHGDKSKPHYRKKRVVAKKLGRSRKNK